MTCINTIKDAWAKAAKIEELQFDQKCRHLAAKALQLDLIPVSSQALRPLRMKLAEPAQTDPVIQSFILIRSINRRLEDPLGFVTKANIYAHCLKARAERSARWNDFLNRAFTPH